MKQNLAEAQARLKLAQAEQKVFYLPTLMVANKTPVQLLWAHAHFATSEAQEVFRLGTI
jgi:hypothetical protein